MSNTNTTDKGTVLLIGFYNTKALGLRYLENALTRAGYGVKVLFFKSFNSVSPKSATPEEMALLKKFAAETKPVLIGLSVMASLYLDTVKAVSAELSASGLAPVQWGGVYATMFPEESLQYADYVIRGEGEEAITELLSALRGERELSDIKNLTYRGGDGGVISNPMRPLMTDLDEYGIPRVGGANKYFIENGALVNADPQAGAVSYELSASRGCPFACTYCCSINLSRLTRGGGKYVRFRDVNRVIEELIAAKRVMKKLVVVHFWDEIFCDDDDWIDTFAERYKKEIGLPFEIWGHPLKTSEEVISKLRGAGLYKVVMGIQSGSPYIRREIFNRPEAQEDIVRASGVLSECGVPQVAYDFMLRHPFETAATMRESFELCMRLAPPFELQLHGLNFLPGTDIVERAIKDGLVSAEDMDKLMHAPMQSQYDMHWKSDRRDEDINAWYDLIFLTQFKSLKSKAAAIAAAPFTDVSRRKIAALRRAGERLSKIRYFINKGKIILLGISGGSKGVDNRAALC